MQVHIDYLHQSAQAGKIAVMVRDETDAILNTSTRLTEAAVGIHFLELSPVEVMVPEFGSQCIVEPSLSPNGDTSGTAYSRIYAGVLPIRCSRKRAQLQGLATGVQGRSGGIFRCEPLFCAKGAPHRGYGHWMH